VYDIFWSLILCAFWAQSKSLNCFLFFKKEVAQGGEQTRVLSISFIFSFSPLYRWATAAPQIFKLYMCMTFLKAYIVCILSSVKMFKLYMCMTFFKVLHCVHFELSQLLEINLSNCSLKIKKNLQRIFYISFYNMISENFLSKQFIFFVYC
jgi:hypothetical protein